MSEDDTFNRLRRIPFEQMRQIVCEFNLRYHPINDRSKLYRQMEANGWTLAEYHDVKDRMGPIKAGIDYE